MIATLISLIPAALVWGLAFALWYRIEARRAAQDATPAAE